MDQVNATPAPKQAPWNKGKLTGAKPPLRPKHVRHLFLRRAPSAEHRRARRMLAGAVEF
jgi:hypothetical protein